MTARGSRFVIVLLFGVLLVSLQSIAVGQQRTWTSKSGKFSVDGTFVEQSGGNVKLKRADNGKVISVAIDKLSKADRDHLRGLAAAAKGSATKGSGTKGSATKGSDTKGSATKGSATKGSATKGSATKGSATKGSDTKGSATKGSDTKGSSSKGSGTKGSDTKAMGSGTRISGKAQWSNVSMFDEDGKEEPRDLELLIEAESPAAANAIEYGMIQLSKCETDLGKIEIKKSNFSFSDPSQEFVKVTRSDNEFFNDHPKGGIRLTLRFAHPEQALKQFTTVEGEFKIKTGGSRDVIQIEQAPSKSGQNIEHEKLDSLGIEATIEVDESALRLKLTGELDAIYEARVVTKDGDKPDGFMGNGWSSSGDMKSFDFQFEDEDSIGDDLVIELGIAENLEEQVVPFKVENLRIPAPE